MKIPSITAAIVLTFASTAALAAPTNDYVERYSAWARQFRASAPRNAIAVDGLCEGMSYGSGATSCGTETGGPVGGLSSRN